MIDSTGSELTSTQASNDSDRTVSQTSGSGSTDSEKTIALRLDSQDSQVSDPEVEGADRSSPRQNSVLFYELKHCESYFYLYSFLVKP